MTTVLVCLTLIAGLAVLILILATLPETERHHIERSNQS